MRLNLTPEQEKLAKEAMSKDVQTAEEIFMNSVYLILSRNQEDDYPEFPDLGDKSEWLQMKVDKNGTFVFPENTPEHVKELLMYAE